MLTLLLVIVCMTIQYGMLATEDTFALETVFSWWLGGTQKVKLLYSVAIDGGSSIDFHKQCDNKGPTITVIYNPLGSVYGGYTSMSWQYSTGTYVRDNSAFLFSLKKSGIWNPSQYPVSNEQYAIYNGHDSGPAFGRRDLRTFENSLRKNGANYTLHGINFGYDYEMYGDTQIHDNYLTITNLEVYSVFGVNGPPEESWRTQPVWDKEFLNNLTDEVAAFTPITSFGIPRANILLLGPIRSGKTSFFNTVNSVFRGYVSSQEPTGRSAHSVTQKYRIYKVKPTVTSEPLNFQLHDTAGTEDDRILDIHELELFLNGHIPNGYKFSLSMNIDKTIPGFVSNISLSNSIHCVALVLDGSNIEQMSRRTWMQLISMKDKINEKGIPCVVLLTKIDKVCPYVETNLTMVFRSEAIKRLVNNVAEVMGLPRSHILPMKNYEKQYELHTDTSILALLSLRQMLRFSMDHMSSYRDMCTANSGIDEVPEIPRSIGSQVVQANISATELEKQEKEGV